MEIWLNQERLSKVPLEDLGVLMVENTAITVTGKLLDSLARHGAIVSVCDPFHLPASLLLPLHGVALTAARTRAQCSLSLPKRKQIWKQIIAAKIRFQGQVLGSDTHQGKILFRLADEVAPGDPKNHEASAARHYWQHLFKAHAVDFKRSSEHEINTYLNYGYSVVRSAIARAIVAAGLTPVFGVFYESHDNYFALADDFIEVFRPLVDLHIKGLLSEPDRLDQKSFKRALLGILTKSVMIKGECTPFLTAIDQLVDSYVGILEGRRSKLLLPDLCEFQATD